MSRAKTKQVQIPESAKPWPDGSLQYYDWRGHLDEIAILMGQEHVIRNIQEMLDCGECKQPTEIQRAYKCLYCGVWYCFKCAEKHFGLTVNDWHKQKRDNYNEAIKLP